MRLKFQMDQKTGLCDVAYTPTISAPQYGRRQIGLKLATGYLLLVLAIGLSTETVAGARLVRQATDETATTTTSPQTTSTSPEASAPTERPKTKIPPVNFTLVDELFNEPIDEALVASKWQNMDKQLLDGVRSILKLIFPHIVSMSTDAKVSGDCSGAILKWILNLRNLRSWAVKMLDATGKPAAGILAGQLTMFGNYKQCLAIRAPDEDEIELVDEFREYFRGQYCVLQMRPQLPRKPQFYSLNSTIESLQRKSYKYYEKTAYDELAELAMAFNFVNIRADLCVPSRCSRDDIQRVADFLSKKVDMRARVLRCETELADEDASLAAQLAADPQQAWWLLALTLMLVLVLASTLLTLAYQLGDSHRQGGKRKQRELLSAMSLQRSLVHVRDLHLDTINDTKPVVLYTLRLVIVGWICLVTLTSQLNFQFLRDLLSLRDLIMMWPMQLLVNSSLQFDALLVLSAFTYSYANINSNLKDLVKFNVGKYFRFMPSIMFVVGLVILAPLTYRNKSPVWTDFVERDAQVCKSTGLINLTFLQNLLSYDAICLPWTWILCVELQLSILSIPLVYMMNKQFDLEQGKFRLNSTPILSLVLVALVGVLLNFLNVYQNQLPAAWFETFPDQEDRALYFTKHLAKTWSHLSAFAVGLLSGYLCSCQSIATFSGRPYGRKCCHALMLLTSGLLMISLLFSLHAMSLSGSSHLDYPLFSALYAGLAPLFWSVAWSMLLFYLVVPDGSGQRPSVSKVLSQEANLVRLGRLSFLLYLTFPLVNKLVLAMQEQAIFSSNLMLGYTFLGNMALTLGLAAKLTLLVELPFRRLIKKLALGSRRQCTNLGIINRQLNIRTQNQGPSQDSFMASQHQQLQLQQQSAKLATSNQRSTKTHH